MSRKKPVRWAIASLGFLVGTTALAACAPAVPIPAGPHAEVPICAYVLRSSPDKLGGFSRARTTSQATTAWGQTPGVSLRCGVEVPGPSTDRCIRVTTAQGVEVDWLALEGDDPRIGSYAPQTSWTFITYGRDPAVEVVVDVSAAGDQPTAVLAQLAPAISEIPTERECVGVEDIYNER